MQIIPAIDLRGGRCVRLRQGDFERETVFGDDPAAMAEHWVAEGATRLHLVDLDAAKTGRPENAASVRSIVRALSIPCQLGGGVRDEHTIESWLGEGIERVVVGTQALRDPAWFRLMAEKYAGRLLLGLDARNGQVATAGWLEVSRVDALTLAGCFRDAPLAGVVFTDIARDGMLTGPNLDSTRELAEHLEQPVYASGGVGCLEDLLRLSTLPIAGCIVGRALYDGRFRLSEALTTLAAQS